MAKTNKQKRIFRPWEADEIANNKRSLQKALESPHVEDKSAVRAAINRLSDMQAEHSVPHLTPEQRDKAAKRVAELEGQIREGMLSSEEMRRNPVGAVDQNVWWEKRNKQRIRTWRNLNLALHHGIPADQAASLTSVERLRPRASRLNMEGAQIPSTRTMSFPSESYVANWPAIFGPKEEVAEEPSVVDDPEPPTHEEELLADAGIADRPETAKALGALARGRAAGRQPAA